MSYQTSSVSGAGGAPTVRVVRTGTVVPGVNASGLNSAVVHSAQAGPSLSSPATITLGSASASNSSSQVEAATNSARKVAEVFLTAGHAFQKLGDLSLQLHGAVNDPDERKWSDGDVDRLRDALTRFAHELDTIGESVQGRAAKMMKSDAKRRMAEPTGVVSVPLASVAPSQSGGSSLTGIRRTIAPGITSGVHIASAGGTLSGGTTTVKRIAPYTRPLLGRPAGASAAHPGVRPVQVHLHQQPHQQLHLQPLNSGAGSGSTPVHLIATTSASTAGSTDGAHYVTTRSHGGSEGPTTSGF